MSEQRRRPARLEIGQEVVRTPETIFEEAHGKAIRRPMRGRVDYIHPMGRFHIVAFKVRGKIIKETFQGVEVSTMDRKAEFMKIWTERVQREYADDLLAWLERETDFFEAPASTRHHGAHPGGLLDHSLNVYHRLRAIVCVETYGATTSDLLAEDVEETVAVLALLHDVCKVNCYHTETRRRKNPETGYWEDYQTYAFRDPLPLGHGEKSLYLIQRHMDLEPEEALAIRWHMGAYDNAAKGDGRALSAAMAASPWVWRLQQADMCAAWVDEREAAEE